MLNMYRCWGTPRSRERGLPFPAALKLTALQSYFCSMSHTKNQRTWKSSSLGILYRVAADSQMPLSGGAVCNSATVSNEIETDFSWSALGACRQNQLASASGYDARHPHGEPCGQSDHAGGLHRRRLEQWQQRRPALRTPGAGLYGRVLAAALSGINCSLLMNDALLSTVQIHMIG